MKKRSVCLSQNLTCPDVLPDSLLNLFGDIHIGGDLEIELDENPKKLRGARKFRK